MSTATLEAQPATKARTGIVVQAYLFFDGKCEEAFEFYKRAVEAKENVILRFKDSPEPCEGASGIDGNKIMHMSFTIGDTEVMASDGMCEGKIKHDGFSLAISTPSDAKTSEYFNALVAGGEVIMPVAKTFWSSSYGMLKDKFGVTWMVMTTPHGG